MVFKKFKSFIKIFEIYLIDLIKPILTCMYYNLDYFVQPCKAYIISAIICGDKAIWLALPKLAKGLVLHALASLGDDEPISPILCSILQVDPPFLSIMGLNIL